MRLLVAVAAVALCLVVACNGQEPEVWHCNGETIVTDASGSFTDHTGPVGSSYLSRQSCLWIIRVPSPSTYITITLTKFHLELDYDFLYIYDGDDMDAPLLAQLTGEIPGRHYVTSGATAIVAFITDEWVTDLGFALDYYGSSCPNKCEGRGFCEPDNTCDCDLDFSGEDCSLTNGCLESCNAPRGSCESVSGGRTECVCTNGWHGDACDDPYCLPFERKTASSGHIVDHVRSITTESLGNRTCSWLIEPAEPASNIVLTFNDFDTGFAELKVYDGVDENAHLIGSFEGYNLPPAVIAHSGFMFLTYSTPTFPASLGFDASYETNNCNCNGHGKCIYDTCRCEVGWEGATCTDPVCSHNCYDATTNSTCVMDQCVCGTGYDGADCSICLDHTLATPLCYDDCQTATVLNGTAGTFSDGVGSYAGNAACNWAISVPDDDYTAISIRFTDLNLGAESTVIIYDGDSENDHIIARLTGSDATEDPTVTTSGTSAYVVFNAADTSGEGFHANWNALACPNDCSGNGLCGADNTCQCFLGFTGAACADTECVNGCNADAINNFGPANACVNDQCVCGPGYFGADCSQTFCNGRKMVTGTSGVLKDHIGSERYLPYSFCQWEVIADGDAPLTLVFDRIQMEQNIDTLRVYSSPDHGDTWEYEGRTSGFDVILPHVTNTGHVMVEFVSDFSVEYSGFNLRWFSNSMCPSSCAGHGWCIESECRCFGGWGGSNCGQENNPNKLLELPTVPAEFTINQYEWVYFRYPIAVEGVVDMTIHMKRSPDEAIRWFVAAYERFPEPGDIGAGVTTENEAELVIRTPDLGVWYVGVYGYNKAGGAHGEIAIWASFDCATPCANGVCHPTSTACECEAPYTGDNCDVCVEDDVFACVGGIAEPWVDDGTSWGTVVVIVLFTIASIVCCVCVCCYFTKKGHTEYMNESDESDAELPRPPSGRVAPSRSGSSSGSGDMAAERRQRRGSRDSGDYSDDSAGSNGRDRPRTRRAGAGAEKGGAKDSGKADDKGSDRDGAKATGAKATKADEGATKADTNPFSATSTVATATAAVASTNTNNSTTAANTNTANTDGNANNGGGAAGRRASVELGNFI